jgi:hypothetical protein
MGMTVVRFEPVEAPQGARHDAMVMPKPRERFKVVRPPLEIDLMWLAGEVGPDERMALRPLCETADLLILEDPVWRISLMRSWGQVAKLKRQFGLRPAMKYW